MSSQASVTAISAISPRVDAAEAAIQVSNAINSAQSAKSKADAVSTASVHHNKPASATQSAAAVSAAQSAAQSAATQSTSAAATENSENNPNLPLGLLLSVSPPSAGNTSASSDYVVLQDALRSGNLAAAQQAYMRLQDDLQLDGAKAALTAAATATKSNPLDVTA